MNERAKMYHGQAGVDNYAKYIYKDESIPYIITASMKQINEAYKELMDDLILESQEAY